MQIQTIEANGLQFAYYEQGEGDKFVLCLHGFPDTADTWRELMPRLARAGYHVVAPFMRGYPPTQIPNDGQYSSPRLAEDVVGLLDAFDIEQAILIGHDWGALAAYAATSLAPERFSKLVTVAIPHPRALKFDLPTLIKARHFLTFQLRGRSIRWMQANNYASLATIFRRWSPNWEFSEEDIEPVRQSLAQAGGTEGALGYYWSFWQERNNPEVIGLNRHKTSVPTLSLFGDADGALTMDALNRTESAFDAPYQQVVLPDVGHFLHREVPNQFADIVLEFLKKPAEPTSLA